jgi:hypothetical protein
MSTQQQLTNPFFIDRMMDRMMDEKKGQVADVMCNTLNNSLEQRGWV